MQKIGKEGGSILVTFGQITTQLKCQKKKGFKREGWVFKPLVESQRTWNGKKNLGRKFELVKLLVKL